MSKINIYIRLFCEKSTGSSSKSHEIRPCQGPVLCGQCKDDGSTDRGPFPSVLGSSIDPEAGSCTKVIML